MLTQTDGRDKVTTFKYNAANKLKKRIDHGGEVESYTYYPDGNMKTKKRRNSDIVTYNYDIHGRLASEDTGDIQLSYTYDNNGNQLTVTQSQRKEGNTVTDIVKRTYDDLNRVITKSDSNFSKSDAYYYYDIIDTASNLTGEKSVDPDNNNNTTLKYYDKNGRLKRVEADGKVSEYNYDDKGNRINVIYSDSAGEQFREEYQYYDDNLLCTLTNKKVNGSEISKYTYTYDGAHNMSTKVDSKGTTKYTYDALNRLETVTEPESGSTKTTTYTYDASGNRKTETVEEGNTTSLTSYTYDDMNKLIASETAKSKMRYTYTANGCMDGVYSTPAGSSQEQKLVDNWYDDLDRLIKTCNWEAVKTIENTYNGEGLRVSKKLTSSSTMPTTKYFYEYDKVVLEDESGQKARNVYGTNLLMRTVGGQTLYYMYNGHADVTALIDASTKSVVATYYYDAFGNPTDTTGDANNSITYAGYQYDKETGLYYCNARMYDPKIARFLQEDTYTGDPNDPLSLNLYTYCHNEPLMYDDPTGYDPALVTIGAHQATISDVLKYETGYYGDIDDLAKLVNGNVTYAKTTLPSGGLKSPVTNYKEAWMTFTNKDNGKKYGVSFNFNGTGLLEETSRRAEIYEYDFWTRKYKPVHHADSIIKCGTIYADMEMLYNLGGYTGEKFDVDYNAPIFDKMVGKDHSRPTLLFEDAVKADFKKNWSLEGKKYGFLQQGADDFLSFDRFEVPHPIPYLQSNQKDFDINAFVGRVLFEGTSNYVMAGLDIGAENLALKLDSKIASGVSRGVTEGTSILAKSGEIPLTGVEKFDRLVVNTKEYESWATSLERKGYYIEQKVLEPGNPANITREGIVEIDPNQFRYSDLLHESRHIFQNEMSMTQTGKTILNQGSSKSRYFRRIAEIDAYKYEMNLAETKGFSQEYIDFLSGRIDFYSKGAVNVKVRLSPTVGDFANSLKYFRK